MKFFGKSANRTSLPFIFKVRTMPVKIIISPAKKMMQEQDFLEYQNLPVFLEQTEKLRKILRAMPITELKQLLQCNDSIATLNYNRYQAMNLTHDLSPAIPVSYTHLGPHTVHGHYTAQTAHAAGPKSPAACGGAPRQSASTGE